MTNPIRGQLKRPRQNDRGRESEQDEHNDEARRPAWDFEEREGRRGDLDEKPANQRVGDRDLVNIAPLELGEKVLRVDS